MRSRLTLSTKVLLLALLNVTLLTALSLLFMRVQFRVDWQSFLLSPAQDRILAVAGQLGLDLYETSRDAWDGLLQRYSEAHGTELRLFDSNGRQLAGPRTALPAPVSLRLTRAHHDREDRRDIGLGRHGYPMLFLGTAGSPTRHWVGVPLPLPGPGGRRRRPGLLVVASSSGSFLFFDPKPWLFVGCAVLALSALVWIPFVRGVTGSVARMTRATGQIAEGRFEIELPVSRHDELGQLSASINSMASRLKRLVAEQKRFLGDAAHELCSPLARIHVALGILERSAAEGQVQAVADLQEDAAQMSALVTEILSFSKASLRAPEVRSEAVPLEAAVRSAIAREGGEARIECSIDPQLSVLADPDLLFRALSNVIRNAVRYAGAAGPVQIAAVREGHETVIRVCDCGPGLPASELEAVFEPFYRPETARTREGGGVGLGLAIVRACVEACQGTVRCRNRVPGGLEVEIRIPSAAAPAARDSDALPHNH
jgi:two-component system sensor histidine kinase CpxA